MYNVDKEICVRCGASASLAPSLVDWNVGGAVFVRQPQTAEEHRAAEFARLICPVGAISKTETDGCS
jgi:ferredoxin